MERLDNFLVRKGFSSREKAKVAIKEGKVKVNGTVCFKPSFSVCEIDNIEFSVDEIVSRGYFKIQKAFEEFKIKFDGKVVLDIGSSTGGFTQFALNHGAEKVYAVDVGKSELSPFLREEKRVFSIEGKDFRKLKKEECPDVDLIIGDLSFISLKKILPHTKELFGEKEICMLFKPQFECGAKEAKKYKGVVLDKSLHKSLLQDFFMFVKGLGFQVCSLTYSPITGKNGNIEYLFYLNAKENDFEVSEIVDEAFSVLRK